MKIISDGTSLNTEIYDDDGNKIDPLSLVVSKIEWEITGHDDAKLVLHIFESEDSMETIRYFPSGKTKMELNIKPENVVVIKDDVW